MASFRCSQSFSFDTLLIHQRTPKRGPRAWRARILNLRWASVESESQHAPLGGANQRGCVRDEMR